MRLNGRVALIVGAGSGIGRAALTLFAREGATVVGIGRTAATLAESASLAGGATTIAGDLVVEGVAERAVAEVVARYDRLDLVVNAAGVGYTWAERSLGTMNAVDATTLAKWQNITVINLDAGYLVARAKLPRMRAQGGGSIVDVASISGLPGLPAAHAYTVAKAGLINLTRSLCVAYAIDGIRANRVAPGSAATPMVASILELFDDPVTAEAISEACLFLASDAASYCNGTVLVVDGGTSARQ